MCELISVIVPIYNVEQYLERCVISITGQTYKKIEIILVDDGSTDKCPEICDRMALQDERIRVVHKENGGLSSARNAGIDAAQGEYLVFVDSDDWIHPDYVECFYKEAKRSGNKMIIGEFVRCNVEQDHLPLTQTFEIIPMDVSIPRMLRGEWISSWAKMYHRSLFEKIRFPEGRINEDYAILIYLFEQSCDVSYTKDVVYFYYRREGSITHSPLNPHSFDEYVNGIEVYDYCKHKYPQWAGLALNNLTASIIKLTGQCVIEDKYWDKYSGMREYVYKKKADILSNKDLAIKYKPFIISMIIGETAHRTWLLIYNTYKRVF